MGLTERGHQHGVERCEAAEVTFHVSVYTAAHISSFAGDILSLTGRPLSVMAICKLLPVLAGCKKGYLSLCTQGQ